MSPVDRPTDSDRGTNDQATRTSRRSLLAGSAVAVGTALAARSSSLTGTAQREDVGGSFVWNQDPVLVAVAATVLPGEALAADGRTRTLQRFAAWVDGFEPVAELDHRYLSTDEIPYGPPDPRPLWRAQLEALETEAQKRHLDSFAALETEARHEMIIRAVDRSVPREPDVGLPRPEHAGHIAVALMTWFFRSSDANDLCHGKRIGRHECRGMRGVALEPRPLPSR